MNITEDDIPYNLHYLVEVIGVENFLQVCKGYGGTSIYIPVYDRVTLRERDRSIVADYNGKNMNYLRKKYSISNQQIKRILAKENCK